jgi:DNA-binding response OmpR family regulator
VRVLVVEDEELLAGAIATGLRRHSMAVDVCHSGRDALDRLIVTRYDVVVLDRDLPDVHGDIVCRELVSSEDPVRVIMLTASGGIRDRVQGLGLGADDYLTKPFAFAELVARIQALARRSAPALPPTLTWFDLELDVARHQVAREGMILRLSVKEFAVLEVLLRAQGATVSSTQLLEQAWDENANPDTNAVRMAMVTLRRKLGEPGLIETVTGVGYRLIR